MGAEVCLHCKQEIPAGACQQGQLIDGDWYPLHVGCADAWCAEVIPVWTIHSDGQGYTVGEPENVAGHIESMEMAEVLSIKRWEMPRLKYLTLPEFTGF
jgi:hypothetical protein